MKKVLLLDEAIVIAIKNGLSVTQVRDLFLTPDLTPGAPLLKRSVHARKQRQPLQKRRKRTTPKYQTF